MENVWMFENVCNLEEKTKILHDMAMQLWGEVDIIGPYRPENTPMKQACSEIEKQAGIIKENLAKIKRDLK